jgi:hypothetical protein
MELIRALGLVIGLCVISLGGAQFVKGNLSWSITDFLMGSISIILALT